VRRPSPASSADSPTDRTSSRVRTVPVGVVTFVPERVQPCNFFGVAVGAAAFLLFVGRVAFRLGLLRVAFLRAITEAGLSEKNVELSVMGVALMSKTSGEASETGKQRTTRNR